MSHLRFASGCVVVVLFLAVNIVVLRFQRHICKQIPSSDYVPLTLDTSAPARPVLLVFMTVLSLSRQLYEFS